MNKKNENKKFFNSRPHLRSETCQLGPNVIYINPSPLP